MDRLHVCLIFGGTGNGGLERHVGDLANRLVTRHRVTVIAHEVHRPHFVDDVEYFPAPLDRWRFSPRVIYSVVSRIRSLDPSVVHAHGRKAGSVMAIVSRFLSVPRVLTLHNPGDASAFAKRHDYVIGVSTLVTEGVEHPRKCTIFNGRDMTSG